MNKGKLWDRYGATPDRWEYLKSIATSRPVWLFSKGPSFNKSFPWRDVPEDAFIIAVNEAVEHVPGPDLSLTYDPNIRAHLINKGYASIMISAIDNHWPDPKTSGDFAFIVAGELGIKHITTVGLDFGVGNGFKYAHTSGNEYTTTETCDRAKKACLYFCDQYNIKLTRFNQPD